MIGALSLLIKVTLILAAALGLDARLRRRRVLACAAMWNAALLILALLPVAMFAIPPLELPWLPRDPRRGDEPARVSREMQPLNAVEREVGGEAFSENARHMHAACRNASRG
jgi:hypothetical protein